MLSMKVLGIIINLTNPIVRSRVQCYNPNVRVIRNYVKTLELKLG